VPGNKRKGSFLSRSIPHLRHRQVHDTQ